MTIKHLKSVLCAVTLLASAPVAAEGVKLCHIANAGFLVEGEETAVLFDAARVTDEYDGEYGLPSAGLMADLTLGKGAFEKVKLAFVSHKHNDHFDAGATLAHLRADADVTYLMPPEAFEMLKQAGLTEAEEARAMAVLPPWEGGPLSYDIAGVKVKAYRVDHGPNRPQNIGFHVTVDGVSFFHTGDINASGESLRKAGLGNTPVDVMLLAFWYGLNNPQQSKTITDMWQIGTVVPMHLAPGERGWMNQYGGRDQFLAWIHGQWPGSVQLTDEMACHTFEAK
ncbi:MULTISPECIES: MBL fold metallo-hydrolase [Kordiimonas]|jgi:L-ascorbate metabolism protein UlaG (beta-lactamase superfamily)|uniref:MBL fold metallo-hydrolase n=1 Tax=Kordiimonas TaxID=288021 RepID=UPI002579FDA0|nr:MBL fold metallo-hydrolase [Kordiimonas sp. UBA4487]